MFLAKLSINRPILTTMALMVFIIFGLLGYNSLNLNQMPDVEIPYITIQTIYPGAGPKEIETQITKKIEDAVSTVSQIEKVESYTLDGVSIVVMEFQLDKDVNVANQEVKDKIDEILNELPDDAQDPIVQKVDFKAFPIVDVILSGNLDGRQLFEIADKTLKDRFSQIEGVAKVNITGGQEREIHVELDNKITFENSISLPQLLQLLAVHNQDIPGGYFKLQGQEYTVRLDGTFDNVEAIRDLEIPTAFGPKKVRQFADVKDAGKKVRERAIYFDNITKVKDDNVVRLGIVKSSEGNVVKVAEAIRESLPEIREILPEGCSLEIINDNSEFVQSTVDDTLSNIILGVLFTSIVLLIFLHDIRSTIIVALSMPTSIISTFLLMQMFDMTLNIMSLMGLSVSVGVLVANSVVVIENIFRHKNMGKNNKQASLVGTTEVTVAVLAATATNLVVFLPIAAMTSMVGKFLVELALAASFSTIFSLVMSFTLTPMLASLMLPKTVKTGSIGRFMENMESKVYGFYRVVLSKALKTKLRSFIIFALSIVILIFSFMYYGPKLGFEFMPVMDSGKLNVEVELPEGFNLDETAKVLNKIESKLKGHKEVEYLLTNLGKKSDIDIGTNMAVMMVQLVDTKDRDLGIEEMITVFTKDLASVPNARIKVVLADNMGPGTNPVEFFLLGQELDTLEKYKEVILNDIRDIPGLINLDQSSRPGKPEITVYPKRDKISQAGLTVMDIALTLRASIEGIVSSKYRELGNEYDIMVTLNDESVNTPDKIRNIPVVSRNGTFRLSQLADIKFTTGFSKILHRDKYTSIQFTGGNAAGVPIGNVTSEIDKRLEKIDLPTGYRTKWGGSTKMMNDMVADMMFAFFLAIILTYMLLAAILESFLQPVIILITLPLAFIGVFSSLYYTGISLGITSMMAIIMLIGIVVNNAILILDYANQLRRESGYSAKEALLESAPTKLKPIIMSSTAIILGMLPMALGIGDAGSEMRVPLGVVSIGGLIISTLLTLFVIPALYYLISRSKIKVTSGNLPVEK